MIERKYKDKWFKKLMLQYIDNIRIDIVGQKYKSECGVS